MQSLLSCVGFLADGRVLYGLSFLIEHGNGSLTLPYFSILQRR